VVLMENAGRQVVAAMEAAFDGWRRRAWPCWPAAATDGGDGFVIARVLWQDGVDVRVYVVGAVADIRGDARLNLEILGRLGLDVIEVQTSGTGSFTGPTWCVRTSSSTRYSAPA